jgi:hypothetical protein
VSLAATATVENVPTSEPEITPESVVDRVADVATDSLEEMAPVSVVDNVTLVDVTVSVPVMAPVSVVENDATGLEDSELARVPVSAAVIGIVPNT